VRVRTLVGLFTVAAALAATVAVPGAADAAREPTRAERAAVTAALPAWLRREPVGCVWLDLSMANDGRYALVRPVVLNPTTQPCLRYAANGYWILRKTLRWRIVFNGSDPPPCSLRVPHDLTPCLRS